MARICKYCGAIIFDDEEELWGHIQMEHEETFEEIQDFDTPDMIEQCYTVES